MTKMNDLTMKDVVKVGAIALVLAFLAGCSPSPTAGPPGSKTLACTDTNYMYSFHYTGEIGWDKGKYTFMDADSNKIRNVYNFACYEVQE